MKPTQEEWSEIDRIKAKKLGSECDTFEDLNYCLQLLDKLHPKSRERFTYEYTECTSCGGSGWQRGRVPEGCDTCGGLGKVKTKIRRQEANLRLLQESN